MRVTRETEPDVVLSSQAIGRDSAPPSSAAVPWTPATRIAFRFSFIYFTLYILTTQMWSSVYQVPSWLPSWLRIPAPGQAAPLRNVVTWVATDVLRFPAPLFMGGGSGDKPYDWAHALTLVLVALAAAAIWSALDRGRVRYDRLHTWFRVFLRFGLGGTMLTYGMIKALPMQMPYPTLTRLLEPYGHFSLMGVLWSQIGASPAYEMFTGLIEITCALLLFIPGLTLLGSLLTLAAGTHVFVLNMSYDVPVKLFSLHLVLMSLVLLAPDARRLLSVLVLNRTAGPSTMLPLATSRRWRTITVSAQLALGAWLLFSSYAAYSGPYRTNALGPRPPLYGIWNVERMWIEGVERLPLVTDWDRFRRVVIQSPTAISFQRMDDTFSSFVARLDAGSRTLLLSSGTGPAATVLGRQPLGQLKFGQPAPGQLVLDGEMDRKKVKMELRRFDHNSFRLVQGRFRWIQNQPFNR
jgi:hypothetical protein